MRQFWMVLTAAPDQQGMDLAREVLSDALLAEFVKMQPSEQAHSLTIAYRLKEQGESHPDLMAAALMHDVGKILVPLSIWERTAIVLGQRFFPETARKWGRTGEAKGWKRAFVVGEQHAEWGANLAAEAGASELTVALIRRHQKEMDAVTKEKLSNGTATLENILQFKLQSVDRES